MIENETHIESQSLVNVVMLNGESENEATKNERNDIVHVSMSHVVGGGDSEQREQKQRRHGGDRHRYGFGQPPGEHPRQHRQHVPAAAAGGPLQLHEAAYGGA